MGSAWLCFFPLLPPCFFATWFRSLAPRPALHFFCTSFWIPKWNLPRKTCWAPNSWDGPLTVASASFVFCPQISESIAGAGNLSENVFNLIFWCLWMEPAFPLPGFADRSSVECQRLLDLGWTKTALAHVTWRGWDALGCPKISVNCGWFVSPMSPCFLCLKPQTPNECAVPLYIFWNYEHQIDTQGQCPSSSCFRLPARVRSVPSGLRILGR